MSERIDWERARERLAAARLALDEHRSPEEEQALLHERARVLATPVASDDGAPRQDVVRFTLCGEPFAVAAEHVVEATAIGEPTPVPGTPEFLLGVVNHRGRVLPVVDLRRQLVPDGDRSAELTQTVTVTIDELTFGIAAETVQETSRERLEALDRELVTVLDLQALAADPRLRIDEE
jgi:purine-binding chemotaxis protein CheW